MTKIAIRLIGAALLVSLCLPAHAEETKWKELSEAEWKPIRDKIASNWNIAEPALSCATPLRFDIRLGTEGVVEEVVLTKPKTFETSDPCRAAADLARRAILKSSPLPVSGDTRRLKVDFDTSDFQ